MKDAPDRTGRARGESAIPPGRGHDRPLGERSARGLGERSARGSGRTTREAARGGWTRLARGRRSRGQSNVIGTVLLLGLVVMGTTTILAMGSATLANSQQQTTIEGAEMALTQFDASVSNVAFGGAESQRASVPIEGGASLRADPAAGWMNVSVHNSTTDEVEHVVLNRSLGAVFYENDDTTIAYQAGGVWKRTGEHSTMLTPPEIHYRDGTLTLPLIAIEDGGPLHDEIRIARLGPVDRRYPDASAGLGNPVGNVEVRITVHSEYYRSWAEFFEKRTDGAATVDHAAETVTLRLVNPWDRPPMDAGVTSASSATQLVIDDDAYVDSYDSSAGSYSSQPPSANGHIVIAGGVSMDDGGEVRGDLVSGSGTVSLEASDARISGNLSYGGSMGEMKGTVDGWIADNGSSPAFDAIDPLVTSKVTDIRGDNDNAGTPAITAENRLDESRARWELTAGRYYFEDFEVEDSQALVLNTSSGDVVIAVEDETKIEGDVRVTGDGTVEIYQGARFRVIDANVTIPGDDARRLWVYGPSDLEVRFDDNVRFVGVVYAPGSEGRIRLDRGAEVFGALVGRVTDVDRRAAIHYDEALRRHTAVASDGPGVTFLHIGVYRVTIENG